MNDQVKSDAVAATPPHPARTEDRASTNDPAMADALTEVEGQMSAIIGTIRSDTRDTALAIDPALQPFGLKVLRLIARRGPLQSSVIARTLYTDRSVISRQITQLCELGLVELHTDADDGRVRLAAATPLALARIDAARGGEWALFSGLESWTVSEIRELTRLLTKLNQRAG